MRSLLRRLGRDGIAAIVLLIVAAAGAIEALSFPADAAAWPLWMWGVLAFLSLLLLISALRRPTDERPEP
jgi:hypothetical protein